MRKISGNLRTTSSIFLIGFLLMILLRSNFALIDKDVNSWSASIHADSFTQVAKIIAYGFDTNTLLVVSVALAAFLFYKKLGKDAILLVFSSFGGAALMFVIKEIVHSPRPLNGLMQETGFSFPSGHTTSTVIFLGILAYLTWKYWKPSRAKTIMSIFVAASIVVGFSRIYLNVHWMSDVIGGYMLGLFWIPFSIIAFDYLEKVIHKI